MEDYGKTVENELLEHLSVSRTLLLISASETSGKIEKLGESGPEHRLEHQVCAHSSAERYSFK